MSAGRRPGEVADGEAVVRMAVVASIVVTVVVTLGIFYGGMVFNVRNRSRGQTMPVGPPIAAEGEVVLAMPPDAARDHVLEVLARRGLRTHLTTTSQVIAGPPVFPAGPFGRVVYVWFHPSVGVEASQTRLVLEVQEIIQPHRQYVHATEAMPTSIRDLDQISAELEGSASPPAA